MKKIVKDFIDRYLDNKGMRRLLVNLATIEDLYSNTEKLRPFSSETINTSEAKEMPLYDRAKYLQQETYSLPDIYTVILSKVIYCPKYSVVLTNARKVISDSISTYKDPIRFSISELYLKKVEKISGICTILRSTNNTYYHTLIDNIPRLYLLDRPQYKDLPEIKLLISSEPTKIESFFLDKCCPKNVKITVTSAHQLYSVEKLIFPTFMTRRFSAYLPPEYLEYFLNKVGPQRSRNRINRIFISRVQTKKGSLRCILNEEELFETLKKYGFKKYILENLSLQDQIELFYDAEYVVAAHGAGLANTIFSSKIKIIELFPTPFVIPHYYYLSKALGHTYRYWCSVEKSRDANFRVNVSEISEIMANLERGK
ncbi:MAG: glycosyltransferase family 61 protein [Prochloraceae cyanobacterium]|nr:glycosyltransferase family 61 protein [Prochloraceae cyanobacterium]